jgi:hypothetical protein
MDRNRGIIWQIVVILATIATIAVNILANVLPINGQTTGEISDQFAIYFVPAGYVFSIWGLIYIGWIAYSIFQALPAQRDNPRLVSIAGPYTIASLANCIWLVLWHYNVFPATLVAMVILLISLIVIYLRLGIGQTRVSAAETWAVRVPFSIYLGWITVATIANVTQVLYYLGWNGEPLSPETWLIIMLAVAVVVAGLMMWTRRDIAYLLVLVWAFIGIALKHAAVPPVATAAWLATAAVAVFVVVAGLKQRRSLPLADTGA